ncbi:MAG TPA: nuclear transport factor 2 family protein, partial [Verrucomicrobiae bacterium]|nr:nuclear transport factor 2 family protein [Verrucomicrobiae bacterium]
DAAASEGKPTAQPAVADGPLSAAEAAALVEAFRAAYEARDVDRLVELFSDDADENGVRGLDAIASNYRATLPTLSQVRYSMPSLAVKGDGPRAAVIAPFFITYRNAEGVSGEVRGQAEWALERRDGHPRIVALSYRLDPTS